MLRLGAGLQAGQLLGWLQLQLGPPRLELGPGRRGSLQLGWLGELGLYVSLLPLLLLRPLLVPLLPFLLLLRMIAGLQVGHSRLGLGLPLLPLAQLLPRLRLLHLLLDLVPLPLPLLLHRPLLFPLLRLPLNLNPEP